MHACPVGLNLIALEDWNRCGSFSAPKARCQINLEIRNSSRARIPIFHFSEILALSLGADDSEEWLVRHLVNPGPVIQKLAEAA